MTIFSAQPVDPQAELRSMQRKKMALAFVLLVIVIGPLVWFNRFFAEKRVVEKFFTAIEAKQYENAFAIWNADQDWRQHADKYKDYTYGQFELDWGPSGDWGAITTHDVAGAEAPKSRIGVVTGVVVIVRLNNRAQPACLWVEKKSKTISFSHLPCRF